MPAGCLQPEWGSLPLQRKTTFQACYSRECRRRRTILLACLGGAWGGWLQEYRCRKLESAADRFFLPVCLMTTSNQIGSVSMDSCPLEWMEPILNFPWNLLVSSSASMKAEDLQALSDAGVHPRNLILNPGRRRRALVNCSRERDFSSGVEGHRLCRFPLESILLWGTCFSFPFPQEPTIRSRSRV